MEDENHKLSKEIKEQGKLIQCLTTRVQECEAKSKFPPLQINENRDDIERIDNKHQRYSRVIYGIPEGNDKSTRDCVQELFTEMGLPFGVNHADTIYSIGPAKKGGKTGSKG